ncbi:MAG: hypothetical protein IKZ17_03175 [Bacteroidaceae bacterium]|nr:hypothetical protein [Bacteroidaceae bacterium]
MLKETDFKWLLRYKNNIKENPIDCFYCIVDRGDGTGKMYVVEPMYAQDPNGLFNKASAYKYFVFFDSNVSLATEEDKKQPFHSYTTYSGYVAASHSFIAVFDTLEDAQKRAYTQYAHHFGCVMPHIIDDIEEETRKYFVVGA